MVAVIIFLSFVVNIVQTEIGAPDGDPTFAAFE